MDVEGERFPASIGFLTPKGESMANVYLLVEKAVKVKDADGVKEGFVFPAVVMGVCMFICAVIVLAFCLAAIFK